MMDDALGIAPSFVSGIFWSSLTCLARANTQATFGNGLYHVFLVHLAVLYNIWLVITIICQLQWFTQCISGSFEASLLLCCQQFCKSGNAPLVLEKVQNLDTVKASVPKFPLEIHSGDPLVMSKKRT